MAESKSGSLLAKPETPLSPSNTTISFVVERKSYVLNRGLNIYQADNRALAYNTEFH
jgi:hypothetical protein